ncbi:deoxynucleotidyltransferase terminal-interacting protein 1 isoform X2 [Rhinatrema bivittatum]|uniref:deoxynucleotidyltransferase terminal-interacting protein 1 isoform X2 n=1 Tax=Rhinatrema bivittatum TaxID=194408 RepID=UPI00112D0CFF|nr:deoxynucleotidyltransferase terminal-interacting protein 1 isoform X2 [Rhinatrema bivittatum]
MRVLGAAQGAAMGANREPEKQQLQGGREAEDDEEEEEGGAGRSGEVEQLVPTNPWNIMIKHRQVQRRGRRSQMAVSFTDPVISMDLLRTVLQPSINEDIQSVFNKYMKFFKKAAGNVRDNIGEEVDPEQLIQEACRSCLEQAKLLFSASEKAIPKPPVELPVLKRARQVDEESSQRGSPVPKKRKGRPPGHLHLNDRTTQGISVWKTKSSEPIRREGPKWDPARLNESTTFVLGSRANKALGMGGTRGRIYIKHSDLFKYAADSQDKQWLADNQHMRATGGKMAYLLLEEDIQDLAASDDYRDSPELKMEELKPFTAPPWMIEKMRKYMESMRTENN